MEGNDWERNEKKVKESNCEDDESKRVEENRQKQREKSVRQRHMAGRQAGWDVFEIV